MNFTLTRNALKILSTFPGGLLVLIPLIIMGCTKIRERDTIDARDNYRTWQVYGGDIKGTHYSELDQINRENVSKLKVAWRYRADDMRSDPPSTMQCNPIIVEGIMYITTPRLKAVALDAATGKELWVFDPEGGKGGGMNRGLTYWRDSVDQRLFYAVGAYLYAVNAKDGKPIIGFGEGGRIDLRKNLDREELQFVTSSTPGVVFKDKLIISTSVGEGPNPGAPGHIRAFDVRTGERKWIFHTIPYPGEPGYETWSPDSWKTNGGANSWGGFTLDLKRGIVYFGTGSASYDHWGGNRIGQNLFANCVMALNAETGEYVWHFQVVHHDLWDYDIPCPPTLVTLVKDGKEIDAVAQPTKMGHLFVLNRDTGVPVFLVAERSVPRSDIPGEESWPTQPFPISSLAYARQVFTDQEITDLNPAATQYVRDTIKNMTKGNIFSPPSLKPVVMFPQFNGGSEWPGAAFDPESNTLIVNASNEAEWISMVKSKGDKETTLGVLGKQIFQSICANCHVQTKTNFQTSPAVTPLSGVKERMTKDQVLSLLETGKGQMPSFRTFSEVEKKAIVAWLFQEDENEKISTDDLRTSWRNQIPYVSTGHWDFRDPDGFPVNKRPWGTLNAIDLNKGTIKWQVPLGTYPQLEAQGLKPTGTFNIGGPVVTAGGLIFIGASMDERLHAYDKDTGELLWEFQMDAGGYATPSTFEIGGQQYVVIAAGGGGKAGTKPGNSYYCFALP